MTVKSRSVINSEADANIQDNTAQEITPADVRQRIKDLADSAVMKSDDLESSLTNDTTKVPKSSAVFGALAAKRDLIVRVGTETSSATSTPNIDLYDQWNVTALAVSDTFAAPSGTPTDGQNLIIRIKDDGTARGLLWNAIYRASSDLPLPSTTVVNKTLYLGFKYNSAATKWDLIALLNNF